MTNNDYYQNTQGKPFQLALGDLVQMASERRFDVIGHGCNCLHRNDAGISLAIAQRFPAAELADLATPFKDPAKLGTYSQAHIPELGLTVLNIYTQFKKAGPKPKIRYEALEQACRSIAVEFKGKRMGLPTIGAGLAGGDWLIIKEILGRELSPVELTVVVFEPNSTHTT
jgi:O-acetyl-ADP-ribose deacetylase (regulator of RNase III)